ncbi:hypothetical protein LK437_00920 [Campylobacter rectus]|nr:hypothetical protein [Campylobacter rectus]UEB48950.1 hypothetical protein LK437_00920 [Campylobacter rectus]
MLEPKFREILKYFAREASKISNLTKISEATLCKIFREIRILMSKECEVLKSNEHSEVEFRHDTKTTQENLYQKLLKMIRENPLNLS